MAALLDVYGASAEERQGVLALATGEPAQTRWRAFSARSEAFLQLDQVTADEKSLYWFRRIFSHLLDSALSPSASGDCIARIMTG
ncbi:hypothetical protein ACWDA3_21685 [Nonomuraea rubra]